MPYRPRGKSGPQSGRSVIADWVLTSFFVCTRTLPRRYEAFWFIAYDPIGERYPTPRLDLFGARFSQTLGYSTRDGNAMRFGFEYPDGPFHTT